MSTKLYVVGRHKKEIPVELVLRASRETAQESARQALNRNALDEVKAIAKRLKALAYDEGYRIKHSEALEAVAMHVGYRNFNTLRACLSAPQYTNKEAPQS